MTVPFISITSDGGRIGRLIYTNGNSDFWGMYSWDLDWPESPQNMHELMCKEVAAYFAKAERLTRAVAEFEAILNRITLPFSEAAERGRKLAQTLDRPD